MKNSKFIRNVCILLLVATTRMLAAPSYSQVTKFDLNLSGVALEKVFEEIEKNSEFSIIYLSKEVNLKETVDVNVHQQTAEVILNKVLKNQGLKYDIKDKHIIIYKQEAAAVAPSPQQASRRITGTVKDENGEEVIGANVVEKGTSNGVITDMNGKYTLDVSDRATLVISYIGYVTQEVAVGSRAQQNDVVLVEDSKTIDEVVVVGYGVMRKSDLTGAVAKVSTDDLKQLSTVDVGQALAGRVAGVDIVSNSGEPGAGTKIRIRGYGTINTSDPLYVVDGFPVSDIDYLSPQDIESLEILKDASATAIYGSRGANGVILIKTKGGKYNTKTHVDVTVYGSMSDTYRTVPLLNAWELATLKKELYANSGLAPSPISSAMYDYVIANKYKGTDWAKEISRTGYAQNYNIDVNGGTDRQTYSVGATYSSTQGIQKYSQLDQLTVRLNNTYKLNSDISLGINVIYTHRDQEGASDPTGTGGNYYGAIWPGVMRSDPMAPAWDYYTNTWGEMRNSDSNYQPARQIYLNSAEYQSNISNMFIGNAYLQYDNIAKVKGLAFRAQYGARGNFGSTKGYTPVWYVSADQNNANSRLMVNRNEFYSWLVNAYLMYNRDIDKHTFGSTLGIESQEFKGEMLMGSAADVPEAKNMWYLDQTTSPSSKNNMNSNTMWNRMASAFFRANYTYDSKYMITATVRADGSSKFIQHWGYFPSFSLGWNIHEEEFMKKDSNPINQLKLRAGWGLVGNEASAGASDYVALMTQGYNAVIGNAIQTGAIQLKLANEKLQWEAAEQYNLGVDFSMLDMKLSGTADYFIRNTRDMILATPIPIYVGMTRATTNSGEMRNNGLELTLRWQDKIGQVTYSVSGNASFIKNKVLSLGSPDPVYGANVARLAEPFTRTEVGKEMAYFYGYKTDGLFQTQEEVNNYTYTDANGNKQLLQPNASPGDVKFVKTANDQNAINENDRTYLGSGMADVALGFNVNAAYKGFDMAIFLQSTIGNEIANATVMDLYSSEFGQWNMSEKMMNRWTGPGSTNVYPRLIIGDPNRNNRFSDRYVEDGSYLRIKNVQVGYTFSNALMQKIKISRLRLYASVDNLFVFTNYSGFDPEMGDYLRSPLNNGIDLAAYPRPRTLVFGLNLSF